MDRLIENTEWTANAADLARDLQRNVRVVLDGTTASGEYSGRYVSSVLSHLREPVFVHVPDQLTQAEEVLLSIGHALGPNVAQRVDGLLRTDRGRAHQATEVLETALGTRCLVVKGWDRLGYVATDRDLRDALGWRSFEARSWLERRANFVVLDSTTANPGSGSSRPDALNPREVPDIAPVQSVSDPTWSRDLWTQRSGGRAAYELHLVAHALSGRSPTRTLQGATPDFLRATIMDSLPTTLRTTLVDLSCHGSPLDLAVLNAERTTQDTSGLGVNLGLWYKTPQGVQVADHWRHWILQRRSEPQSLRAVHLRLARRFAQLVNAQDPNAGRVGLYWFHAYRHFVQAGEPGRALEYARYGAPLLVALARDLSTQGDFEGAARLYDTVLTHSTKELLPPKLQAYARHYLHFNRAHAGLDDKSTTEVGYRTAVEGWADNALFWSRLARVQFYQGKTADAHQSLRDAQTTVRYHPQKQTILVARTVRGLLKQGLIQEAVQVWAGYNPDTIQAEEVARELQARVAEGWQVKDLHLEGQPPLVFNRKTEVFIAPIRHGWAAQLRTIDVLGQGESPLKALENLVQAIRSEVTKLIRAYTPDLSPSDRLRKQILLGLVDVVASRLDGERPTSWWVYGYLQRDAQHGLWLHTGDPSAQRFEVPEHLEEQVVLDTLPHLAEVATDENGIPAGPVMRLDPGYRGTDEDLWTEWRRRLTHGA